MILLVEDDVAIGRAVTQGLGAQGFAVRWLRRGADLAPAVARGEGTVVILDLGLPDADGLALCRWLRAQGHAMPVLMLTARGALDDRLDGFAAGADDYLPKPFAFAELVARVAVLARRAAQMPAPPLMLGPLVIDRAQARLWRGDQPVAIEPKPLVLLAVLAAARGAVVPREALIAAVWGADAVVADNTLDVTVSALRRRMAEIAPGIAVRAVKRQGFCLDGGDQSGSTPPPVAPPKP